MNNFPASPGVYLMKDSQERIIYVGKAKNLRARVRSYFLKDNPIKTKVLMSHVTVIDYIVTGNEYEALLLENNLIKRHSPRYNINLKDGKSYPVIRITADPFPRVFQTRTIIQDGSRYFGPYPGVSRLESYLELIEKLYPLRKCRSSSLKKREQPCLYHHIGRCAAVCAGKTSRDEYLRRVEKIESLLSGKTEALRREITEKMTAAGASLQFEKAAEYRDILAALDQMESEQRIVDFDPEVRDYIGYATGETFSAFVVFQMRQGNLLGSTTFHGELPGSEEENLVEFVLQFYSSTSRAPQKLYTSASLGDVAPLKRFFQEELSTEVDISPPGSTRDAAILRLCTENARQELERLQRARGDLPALEELARLLHLPAPPLRIEGFDIAQVGGHHTVASLVSFSRGVPDKSQYKRFRIKSLPDGAIDDFGAMREVLARRYSRVKNEKLPKPDLILIDGGKGQVSAARGILLALELPIPIVGLAKREEEIFLDDTKEPLRLPEGTPALRLLQHVRDEAHRFATTYRGSLQKKDALTSLLQAVPGIGPRRAARIMKAFPREESLLETPLDIIAKSTGISEDLAREIQNHLRKSREGS
ncbi:excinuclease ABC subunit UvrC [Alkalispirochaeta americana]|uniref:excinuclease ABC subunit UvrC n=1 Tax=Alkalispirochaeta americana TaxID=159291 RepID=UPI001F291048|nr:excinuclease ABC subunit UvrC [Alkalispirochaeta americana]